MKKILITLFSIGSVCVMAKTTVDFSTSNYQCNGVKLTKQTKISDIKKNCKNVNVIEHAEREGAADETDGGNALPGTDTLTTNPDAAASKISTLDKVTFNSDKGSALVCYYTNKVLSKCKAGPAPTPAPTPAGAN